MRRVFREGSGKENAGLVREIKNPVQGDCTGLVVGVPRKEAADLGEQLIPSIYDAEQAISLPRIEAVRFGEPEAQSAADAESDARSALGLGTSPISVTGEYCDRFTKTWHAEVREKMGKYLALGESSSWHALRAQSMPIPPMLRPCVVQRFVSCGCKAFPVGGCAQRTCKTCNGRRWGQIRRRVLRSVRAAGGAKWRMMTLAGPPMVTERESLDALQLAWARMRAWFHKRWSKGFTFVACLEVGERNGNLHLHVMAKFPGFISYGDVGEAWARAYPGAVTGGVHFSRREVYLNGQPTGRKTTVFTPESGAYYIAKYATKGTQLLKFPPEQAARILSAVMGRRLVRASQGFWTKSNCRCEDCGWKYGLAQGHKGIEFARGLYTKRKLEVAGRSNARGECFPHWARGNASPGVLVAAEGALLDWVAQCNNRTGEVWTQSELFERDANAFEGTSVDSLEGARGRYLESGKPGAALSAAEFYSAAIAIRREANAGAISVRRPVEQNTATP